MMQPYKVRIRAWLGQFQTLENGCGNDGDFTTTPPAADMSICTSGSITLTYSADDGCTSDSHTSTFSWTQGLQVDEDGPADDETLACAYADDAALQGAYKCMVRSVPNTRERLW